jgi:hypothetical protein
MNKRPGDGRLPASCGFMGPCSRMPAVGHGWGPGENTVFPGLFPYSLTFSSAPISPTIPRRKASTQTTKMTPWITVTQAPSSAR